MAILDTITTITKQWVFDGEVKHLGGKINNLTQSWSIKKRYYVDQLLWFKPWQKTCMF